MISDTLRQKYATIYGKHTAKPKTAKAKAEQLKSQLGKYALYSTALLGVAVLQDLPTAEAAIVHNFGGFTGATNNYNPGGGGASNIPISTNASIKVFNIGCSIKAKKLSNFLALD